MAKTFAKRGTPGRGFTLGRAAFARISAVEGIRLTPEMENDLNTYDRRGLSAAERRKAIFAKYGKIR